MKPDDLAGVTARLLEVIRTQGDVAKLGPDLGGVMSLVAERARAFTNAIGCTSESVRIAPDVSLIGGPPDFDSARSHSRTGSFTANNNECYR